MLHQNFHDKISHFKNFHHRIFHVKNIHHKKEHVLDMKEEGFVDPTSRGRVANYTTKEDKLLCETWKKIGLDPVIGVEQASSTYWECIYEYFKERKHWRSNTPASYMDGFQKWSTCLAQLQNDLVEH